MTNPPPGVAAARAGPPGRGRPERGPRGLLPSESRPQGVRREYSRRRQPRHSLRVYSPTMRSLGCLWSSPSARAPRRWRARAPGRARGHGSHGPLSETVAGRGGALTVSGCWSARRARRRRSRLVRLLARGPRPDRQRAARAGPRVPGGCRSGSRSGAIRGSPWEGPHGLGPRARPGALAEPGR